MTVLAQGHRVMPRSPWFVVFKRNPLARARLFCFHYAGGSTSVFRDWPEELPSDVELVAVRLPGHAGRYGERLIRDAKTLVELLYPEMLLHTDKPYYLFGHSKGAVLVYELALLLQRRKAHLPSHIVVAAKQAPHLIRTESRHSQLPDDKFIGKLKSYEGTPEDVLRHKGLVRLLLPIWRADFALSEAYENRSQTPLHCPLAAFGGREDTGTPEEDIVAWRQFTTRSFSFRIFEGGHFFLHDDRAELLMQISAILEAGGDGSARRNL